MSNRVEQMMKVQSEALDLFKRKNQDYGDAFAKYGPIGVLLRMNDKVSRLQSISKSGITLVNDEKMRDTLIDLHNYSAMAVMLLDEEGEELKHDVHKEDDKHSHNKIDSESDSESEVIEDVTDKLTLICRCSNEKMLDLSTTNFLLFVLIMIMLW